MRDLIMSVLAAILLSVSALLHAGWNLLGKKSHPTTAFFLVATGFSFLILSPLLFIYAPTLTKLPLTIWLLVAATGLFQAIYLWGLAGAYRHGVISIAYPLLRSLPIFFIALFTTLFNQGSELTTFSLLGMILIAMGCFLIPIRSLHHINRSLFLNLSCLFAVFSAIGTIGYTIIDNHALMLLREMKTLDLSVGEISILYLSFQASSASLWLLIIMFNKSSRQDLKKELKVNLLNTALTGLAMTVTYFLVLVSMAYVDNLSYVVVFRQLSIPIAVILGIYLLKEYKSRFKLLGTTLMFGGIMLISF
jgi:drug/metabolite transporter (DMT)-like permease